MENVKTEKRGPGRPAKFSSAKKMEEKINEYFSKCCCSIPMCDDDGHVLTTKTGKPIIEHNPPTMAGLALYLGFADRSSLYDYKRKPEFNHQIRRAIARMEEYAEKQLTVGQTSGAIFWLKNHGWGEKAVEETAQHNENHISLLEMGISKEDIIALAKRYRQ